MWRVRQGFREREQSMVVELCELDGVVIATGGGVVLRRESPGPACRGAGGVPACLCRAAAERTSRDRNRPLLRNAEPGKVLRNLMEIRDPLYREIRCCEEKAESD